MAKSREAPSIARKVILLTRTSIVMLVLAGVGVAGVANLPATARACIGGMPIDRTGGTTPQKARTRWLAKADRGIDVDHPDKLSESHKQVTAIYLRDGPHPSHTYYTRVVVERGDDDVWRVVDAPRCDSWTE